MAAILTHTMYGINSIPAEVDTLEKALIVNKIAIHRTIIVNSPARMDLRPKKIGDHKAFKINCIKNIVRALLTPGVFRPLRQTRKADTPIRKYRVVQTGANNQFGGLKKGFVKLAYQVGIEARVKIEPIKPAN